MNILLSMENSKIEEFENYQKGLLIFLDIDYLLSLNKNYSNNDKLFFSNEFSDVLLKFRNIPAGILGANYFFENFPKNNFLFDFFEKFEFFDSKKVFPNLTTLIEEIKVYVKKILFEEKRYSIFEVYTSLLVLLYIFLQENLYGSSFYFIKETEKTDLKYDLDKFNNHNLFILEEKSKQLNESMTEYLTVDGEIPYKVIKLQLLFVVVYELFVNANNLFDELEINKLYKSRLIYMHNKIIKDPVGTLKTKLFDCVHSFNLEKVIKKDSENFNITLGLLNLEKSYFCMRYYKYNDSDNLIDISKDLFNLKMELTGRLGRKTKFQTFDSAILVLESESSTLENKIHSMILKDEVEEEHPVKVTLDEENPMLEKPNITDDTFLQSGQLSVYDQIYVNAILHHIKNSFPDEDLLREVLLAYANKGLEKSNDWLVYSKLLLFRSLAEDKKSKFIERSLRQIQSLVEQQNDRSPAPYDRLKYIFVIDYPFIWNLKKMYGEAFMNYGAVLTAHDTFLELEMYEECIQCLYVAGKSQRALEFAEKILSQHQDPGVYCILGEIQNNVEYFHKALEVSKNKYTRAYRCLGRYYAVKNE